MKRILRTFVIQGVALYLSSQIAEGLVFQKGIQGLLITSFALTLAAYFIKPIVNLLLIPINLLTFNLFRFITNAITLYIVDLVLVQFSLVKFYFAGLNTDLIYLPTLEINQTALVFLAFSILISVISNLIHWLVA